MIDPYELIDIIESERLKQGIKITELSARTGVTRTTYYHWRERRKVPRLPQLIAVAEALGMTVVFSKEVEDDAT